MDFTKAGLRGHEYERIKSALGREPNDCELRIMGVMWSEHCSYKSTKHLLKLFPNSGSRVVLGPGENAGIIDLGDGIGAAFKVESHNHPSAVAPYQGAATGVGGIIRDILALGARPVASMDGLFFGDPEYRKTRSLSSGIVHGVGGYGNPVGVPTIGGKTVYDSCYNENPLLNAFCIGLIPLGEIVSSRTARPGQAVVLLGSKTGRDGIAGAAFASVELSDDNKASRPSIQIGDPFAEKLLIEACLEMNAKKLIVSMQDMGAAGIISSSSEVAAKSGVAMRLDFDKVPLRAENMEPWEIALSESQERMLLIVEHSRLPEVIAIAGKWELDCAVIGETFEGDEYTILSSGEEVASLPATLIGEGCPPIHWESCKPADFEERWSFDVEELSLPEDWNETLLSLLESPSLASKEWIYDQYDSMVQLNTVQGPGRPLSILRIKGRDPLIAMVLDADPWKCYLDPFHGGAETVARTIRTLAVAGAKAAGLTDCLNFPSPEIPEQYWVLEECIKGMAEASSALGCPVVSGNVSLYNESPDGPILPTPVVGVVGILPSAEEYLPSGKWKENDLLFLVGACNPSLGGSRYLLSRFGRLAGRPLCFSPEAEKDFVERALKTASSKAARSGRTLAGGGLAVALAKDAAESGIGADISIPVPTRKDVFLFGEGGPRALYSVPMAKVPLFKALWNGYPCIQLGKAGGNELAVDGAFSVEVAELAGRWRVR
jgi:phosphoribosylformylglycinamidine synthase